MSPTDQINQFADDIYLTIKNDFYDDLTSEDGLAYVKRIIRFTNMFLDELETTVDENRQPVDWWWLQQQGVTLGTATAGSYISTFPSTALNLVVGENRYVQVVVGGAVVSNWVVVAPSQITNDRRRITEDTVSRVGNSLVFSREFKDYEDGGTIIGDITVPHPRLATTNVKVFKLVQPRQLLVLGVAKNTTLPDIVQGGLSPSYAQKYSQLVAGAIARSKVTGLSPEAVWQDLSGIRGI